MAINDVGSGSGVKTEHTLPFVYVLARSKSGSETVAEGIQTCLADLESRLKEVGCDLGDLVNIKTYLPEQQMTTAGYAEYNEIYRPVFSARNIVKKPSRATVGVPTPTGTEVQMEAFALVRS